MSSYIRLCPPVPLTDSELRHAGELAFGHPGPGARVVADFEARVAKIAGGKWCIATITGTAALYAAASVLGFQGEDVRVPVNAYPAMRNVLLSIGAKIVPAYGPSFVTASNHDLCAYYAHGAFIADCAPALGNKPNDIRANVEVYSFNANKIITTGQGGAIVGDNEFLEREIRYFIHQGYGRLGRTNARMAGVNAAWGMVQIPHLKERREKKASVWRYYKNAGLPMLFRGQSYWMSTVATNDDAEFARLLAEDGIETRVEPTGGVSLPCGCGLTQQDQETVIRVATQTNLLKDGGGTDA